MPGHCARVRCLLSFSMLQFTLFVFFSSTILGAADSEDKLYYRIMETSDEVLHWSVKHFTGQRFERVGNEFWATVFRQEVCQDDLQFLFKTLATDVPDLGPLQQGKIDHILPLCFSKISTYYKDPADLEMITKVQTIMCFYAQSWLLHLTNGRCGGGPPPRSTAGIKAISIEGLFEDQVAALDGRLVQLAEGFLQSLVSQDAFQGKGGDGPGQVLFLCALLSVSCAICRLHLCVATPLLSSYC